MAINPSYQSAYSGAEMDALLAGVDTVTTKAAEAAQSAADAEVSKVAAVAAGTAAVTAKNAAAASAQAADGSALDAQDSAAEALSSAALSESAAVQAIAAKNQATAAATAMQECDNYSSAKAYAVGNMAVFAGSTYRCTAPCTGVQPPNASYWLLIAAKGQDGSGTGDMVKNTYDPNNKAQDIFAYADAKQEKTVSLTAETTLADGDALPFYDASATENRKTTWSNIKAKLKAYFDTLYAAATHSHGAITSDGKVGTSTDKVLTTGAGGAVQAETEGTAFNKSFGTGTPVMDDAGAPGSAATVSRSDHVHPKDTTKMDKAGGTFTGGVTGVSPIAAGSVGFRNIYISASDPSGGSNGDLWIKYATA